MNGCGCPTFGDRLAAGALLGAGIGVAMLIATVVLGNIATGR